MQVKETILVGLTAEEQQTLEDFVAAMERVSENFNITDFTLEDLNELLHTMQVDAGGFHFEIDVNY